MKKCPYCAEEIQDEAIKCRYCGERIELKNKLQTEKIDSTSKDKESEQRKNKKVQNHPIVLEEIKIMNFFVFIMLIPAFVILQEFLLGFIFSRLFKQVTVTQRFMIVIPFFFSVGIWIAAFIYKLKKVALILIISIINLFILRWLFAILFTPHPVFIKFAMLNTVREASIIFIPSAIFIIIFRYSAQKFKFSEIKDIEFDVEDPVTKKKSDLAICRNCGNKTKIANERVLGKHTVHFCDNCGTFLRENPMISLFLGFTEITVTLLLIIGFLYGAQGGSSTVQNGFLLILVLGIYDGGNRLFTGIKAIMKSNLKSENLNV